MNNRISGLVSVIVTNYNNKKYIEECLNSLINQTYKKIEIIIVDDCSTDNSVSVIKMWMNKLKYEDKIKVRLVINNRNMGFSGAVTTGLYLAKGEYIAMQDGDDVSVNDRIEKQVKFLEENKNISMVGCNYSVFNNNVNDAAVLPNFVVFGNDNVEDEFSKGNSPVCFGTILFKGDVFDKIGGLTRRLKGAEDYEFISRAIPYGIDNLDATLYCYRYHEKQRSRKFYDKKSKEGRENIRKELSVLLVLDSFNIGGTETHVLSLAKGLIEQGVKVTILSGKGPLESEFKKLKCKIYNVDFPVSIPKDKNIFNYLKMKICNIIENEEINLIHAHQSASGSISLEIGNELNIACIFTVHGMYYYDMLAKYLKRADKVISVSIPVYQWLLQYNINSLVVPNGVVYDDFSGSNNNFIRDRYNISKDSLIIMYCSRMAWGKIKVCENLIKVIGELKKNEQIDYYGLIVGNGPGYTELKKVADKINDSIGKEVILFEGDQIDVSKYYLESDCVLGTGRVAIEGMASCKKVIAAGNNGYFGLINKENFKSAWRSYFGDHASKYNNKEMYLYEDMKDYYLNKEAYDKDIFDLYKISKDFFDISQVAKQIIEVYLDAYKVE